MVMRNIEESELCITITEDEKFLNALHYVSKKLGVNVCDKKDFSKSPDVFKIIKDSLLSNLGIDTKTDSDILYDIYLKKIITDCSEKLTQDLLSANYHVKDINNKGV